MFRTSVLKRTDSAGSRRSIDTSKPSLDRTMAQTPILAGISKHNARRYPPILEFAALPII
jgi:hypothetical protein